jgi:uncharacterized protein (TIGR02145 family)
MKNKNINLLWMLLFNFCVVQAQTNTNINFNRVGALHFPISTIDSINYTVNTVVCPTTVSDVDGNIYNVIAIGDQCWTKENLRTTHYMNGVIILNNITNAQWASALSGACADYNNNPALSSVYGKLYNWYAVHDPRGLAPQGYHIPTDAEWTQLSDYLGGEDIAGKKMKNTNGWNTNGWDDNGNGTNISGFSGLAGGSRNKYGEFKCKIDVCSNYWSFTQSDTESAWARHLDGNVDLLIRSNYNKRLGFSVRCVRD